MVRARLIFTRQNLLQMERTSEQLANVARGAYVLKDCASTPDLIFIATGSEVELAVNAAEKLTAEGKKSSCGFYAKHQRCLTTR